MILILDNYDSFTYNLFQVVSTYVKDVRVVRNDQVSPQDVLAAGPEGMILSPGPGRPEAAGAMPQILSAAMGRFPILGVCLGHQMIARHFGGRIVHARELIHGKVSSVFHDGKGIYRNLPSPFEAGRYHSLAVDPDLIPDCLEVSSRAEDGEIMGLRHRELPVEGVQFHPESILTPLGGQLMTNFLTFVHEYAQTEQGA